VNALEAARHHPSASDCNAMKSTTGQEFFRLGNREPRMAGSHLSASNASTNPMWRPRKSKTRKMTTEYEKRAKSSARIAIYRPPPRTESAFTCEKNAKAAGQTKAWGGLPEGHWQTGLVRETISPARLCRDESVARGRDTEDRLRFAMHTKGCDMPRLVTGTTL